LLLLYVGAEFIPHKKAGDQAIAYFIWYGIVRLCLEPLRDSQFSYKMTYIMSALWVVIGVVLLISNHLLI
jgi:phosphatidylglycerol:prolipoprotein diacylglycerol transferase